jgi:hypothetical protein
LKSVWFSLLLVFALAQAQNPVSVSIHDPVYPFLERMEMLGYISNYLDGVKPITRSEIADFLWIVSLKRHQLTAIDRRRLDDLLLDYRWELQPEKRYREMPEDQQWRSILAGWDNFKHDFIRFLRQEHPEEENHVLIWETGKDNFYFDYDEAIDYETRSDDVSRSANWSTYHLRGVINRTFAWKTDVTMISLRGNEAYMLHHPILKGSWSQKSDDPQRYADRSGGELALHSDYIDIHFAQQETEWGYGESGKLILSNNVEQYPYLSLGKNWGWAKFTAMHGKLQSFQVETLSDDSLVGKYYPDKWLAAHRLELCLWQRLTLGFNENFIYGNRYADWAYLMPFNFYRATQHKLRDRDNATISIDMEWLAWRGVKLYGTIFLDEFRRQKLGTNWYGNKQAYNLGLFTIDPFGLDNTALRFEYTAVMPWVYTHDFLINAYASDTQPLGHWLGPNSEVFYTNISKDWHQRFTTGLRLRQYKHGDNYTNENIGGNVFEGHRNLLGTQTLARQTRKFLEGILTKEQRFELYARYEIFNDFLINGEFRRISITKEKHTDYLSEMYFSVILKY